MPLVPPAVGTAAVGTVGVGVGVAAGKAAVKEAERGVRRPSLLKAMTMIEQQRRELRGESLVSLVNPFFNVSMLCCLLSLLLELKERRKESV